MPTETLVETRPKTANAVKCSLAAEVLRSFGPLHFPAAGWSMLPVVRPGDTLLVEHVGPDQVRIGDVVVVERDGRLCGHRVVSITEDSGNLRWVTQGDALPSPDRPVAESELLGRVAYLIRRGKCLPVPSEPSVVQRLLAGIVRRSFPAARVLVYLRNKIQDSNESTVPCQG